MAVILYHVGKTPGQTQFGLDTFTEHYKSDATADLVLTDASVPQKGDAHPVYAHMFLTDRNCQETGTSASALDLVYTGLFSGTEPPTPPPAQSSFERAIESASSSKAASGRTTTSPVTLQYYAPTNVLSYVSYGAKGTTNAPTPSEDPVIKTLTISDTTLGVGTLVTSFINDFFAINVVNLIQSSEVVAGHYWSNTARTTKGYQPYVFSPPAPGSYVQLSSLGTGYTVGDTIVISASDGSATITVASLVGGTSGGIGTITVGSNTFTLNHSLLPGTGGTGTGARFDVVIVH